MKKINFKMTNSSFTLKAKFSQGFSLIELMVALVIGLIVSLAIYGVLNVNEAHKRTTTSVNDIDQSGAYAIYQFDKIIRSAGSGLAAIEGNISGAATGNSYGCPLRAAISGVPLLPKVGAFPAPFASVPLGLTLAPAIIFSQAAGTGGDVVMTMTGSGGLGEGSTVVSDATSSTTMKVTSLAGFRVGDLLLLRGLTGDPSALGSPCYLEQVANTINYTSNPIDLPLTSIVYIAPPSTVSRAFSLGQVPMFNLYGVGANNTLSRYDLLSQANATANAAGANPSVFVEGVYKMRAIYGVDTSTDQNVATISWVLPTGAYAAANLLAGTSASNATLKTIKAIKIGLIMQSSLVEKVPAGQPGVPSPGITFSGSSASVTLFADTPTATRITESVTPVNVRYRVYEQTVPIRNALTLKSF